MKESSLILSNSRLWEVKQTGLFNKALIKLPDCKTCSVVWSDDECGWEHVSVSPKHKYSVPSWEDMCVLKDVFFYDEETVYQIHPPKSQYVNFVDNCLHLWRPKDVDLSQLVADKWRASQENNS